MTPHDLDEGGADPPVVDEQSRPVPVPRVATAPLAQDPARFLLQVSDDGCRIDVWCLDCKIDPSSYLLVVSTPNSSLGRFNWHCVEHERGYHAPPSLSTLPTWGRRRNTGVAPEERRRRTRTRTNKENSQ